MAMPRRRLLVVHQGALGDVIVAFPALARLRSMFHSIEAICSGGIGRLARRLGLIDGYLPMENAAVATLYTDHPSPVIVEELNRFHAIILFSFSKPLAAAVRSVFSGPVHAIPPRPEPDEPIHVTDHVLAELAASGLLSTSDNIPAGSRPPVPRPPASGFNIILHPGSGSRRKNWPVHHFIELAEKLRETGMQPQFVLGPADAHLSAPLNASGFPIHAPSDLIALADLLNTAISYVGNDSGVSHLAAFLGILGVVLFGPSDPVQWKPLGSHITAIRPDVDCPPCFEIQSENCQAPICLDEIRVSRVCNVLIGLSA